MKESCKQDIAERFSTRAQAERYKDRFSKGKRRRTHDREATALEVLLGSLGDVEVLLDVGSGTGRFGSLLAGHAARLIQVDLSRHMLAVSKQDCPLATDRSEYVQADARCLPFADNSVDLVFCHRVLNHFPDPDDIKRIVGDLARVSRRYVVVSCLGPMAILRVLRRTWDGISGHVSLDGRVEGSDLLEAGRQAGLALLAETPIRSVFKSAVFLTLVKT